MNDEFNDAINNAVAHPRDLTTNMIPGLPSHPAGIVTRLRRIQGDIEHRDPAFAAAAQLSTLDMLSGDDEMGPWDD